MWLCIDELIDELGLMDIFTTLDAKAVFLSIDVHADDRAKTAFSDGYQLFQFCCLPFGLSKVPYTSQRSMNLILSPVLGCYTLAYLDDIMVMVLYLEETLKLLAAAGLKLNSDKYTFAATTINFQGFQEGVAPDQSKIVGINESPAPQTVKEVCRFLGPQASFASTLKHMQPLQPHFTSLIRGSLEVG